MDGGRLLCTGAPAEVGGLLRQEGHRMFLAMPSAMRIWASVQSDAPCPVTVREGRAFLTEWLTDHPARPLPPEEIPPCGEVVLAAEDVWFKYEEKEKRYNWELVFCEMYAGGKYGENGENYEYSLGPPGLHQWRLRGFQTPHACSPPNRPNRK